jgi:hypothetical protein
MAGEEIEMANEIEMG